MAFHLGAGWASGGYLGVSVFFTLSGFLITSLLVAEYHGQGRIAPRSFWARRARRLLPASLLGLLLALAVASSAPGASSALRGDLLAALAHVANWRWLASGESYADLFASPSPVLHYWSLAIEEQLYVVLPLVVGWALTRSPSTLQRVVAQGIAGSWLVLAGAVVLGHPDVAYYATPARMGEVLVGAALALVARPTRAYVLAGPAGQVLGAAAAGALLMLVVLVDGTGVWTYAGALPATAVLTAVVIAASDRPGPVGRALAWRPLVGLGRISYGVYVYHWPIVLLLTPARTGLDAAPLAAVRIGATLVVALVSYVLVEQPVRRGRWPASRPAPLVAAGALVTVAAVVVAGSAVLHPVVDLDAAARAVERDPVTEGPTQRSAVEDAPHVVIFGDSTALMVGYGLVGWGNETGAISWTQGVAGLGCGLLVEGERRFKGAEVAIEPQCRELRASWGPVFAAAGAEVAIVQVGAWEVTDLRLPGDPTWRHVGDPVLDAALRAAVREVVDDLTSAAARKVLWVAGPPLDVGRNAVNLPGTLPENDPVRMARFNELVREVAEDRPEVELVDLAGWLAELPESEDRRLRPDGVHFTEATAEEVFHRWLGEEIVRAAATG